MEVEKPKKKRRANKKDKYAYCTLSSHPMNFFLFCYFILFIGALPAYMSMYHMHVWCQSASGGEKRVMDPLVLDLETIVTQHISAMNQT